MNQPIWPLIAITKQLKNPRPVATGRVVDLSFTFGASTFTANLVSRFRGMYLMGSKQKRNEIILRTSSEFYMDPEILFFLFQRKTLFKKKWLLSWWCHPVICGSFVIPYGPLPNLPNPQSWWTKNSTCRWVKVTTINWVPKKPGFCGFCRTWEWGMGLKKMWFAQSIGFWREVQTAPWYIRDFLSIHGAEIWMSMKLCRWISWV